MIQRDPRFRIFATSHLAYSLRPRRRAGLFLLAITLPSLFVAARTVSLGVASSLADSTRMPDLRRAAWLDGANPEFQDRLGLAYSYSSDGLDPAHSLSYFRRAAALNPYRATYWEHLALACESLGDFACAGRSLERALSLSPMTPRLQWVAANSLRVRGSLPHCSHITCLPLGDKQVCLSGKRVLIACIGSSWSLRPCITSRFESLPVDKMRPRYKLCFRWRLPQARGHCNLITNK